jgi:hypothetical protein
MGVLSFVVVEVAFLTSNLSFFDYRRLPAWWWFLIPVIVAVATYAVVRVWPRGWIYGLAVVGLTLIWLLSRSFLLRSAGHEGQVAADEVFLALTLLGVFVSAYVYLRKSGDK